jgi:AbrB family looped-hinge helix DNA binding protein
MRSTIDEAGRLFIPKALRDQLGLRPGAVEVAADGAALRIEPIMEKRGWSDGLAVWSSPPPA